MFVGAHAGPLCWAGRVGGLICVTLATILGVGGVGG